MRHQRNFSDADSFNMIRKMGEFREEVVDLEGSLDDTWQWIANPDLGEPLPETGAICPLTNTALTIYQAHDTFLRTRRASILETPVLADCADAADHASKLATH